MLDQRFLFGGSFHGRSFESLAGLRIERGHFFRFDDVAGEYGFLDPIVAEMLRQNPKERPGTIATLKGLIQKYKAKQ